VQVGRPDLVEARRKDAEEFGEQEFEDGREVDHAFDRDGQILVRVPPLQIMEACLKGAADSGDGKVRPALRFRQRSLAHVVHVLLVVVDRPLPREVQAVTHRVEEEQGHRLDDLLVHRLLVELRQQNQRPVRESVHHPPEHLVQAQKRIANKPSRM